MYLASNIQIIFPEYKGRKAFMLKSVSSFEVNSSWKALTDTAEVVIAKKLYFEQKEKVFELVKTGCPIQIKAGYNGSYNNEFEGYVSQIIDDLPVILKCEDNMYLLKRTKVNKSYSSVTLKQLLSDIIPPQFKIDAMDVNIGKWLFKDVTAAQVLTELKDKLSIYCYFKGNTLIAGKIHESNPESITVIYEMTKNVITNDLTYRNKEDFNIRIKLTSTNATGANATVYYGEPDGHVQKLSCSSTIKIEMEKIAKQEYDRLKVDGYDKTLTSFGIPFIKHGFNTKIINKEFPEKNGTYYIDAVKTTFNNYGAYRRVVTLGKRATTLN